MDNYILKLTPQYKDYIWGGEKLKKFYNKNSDKSPLAESWELSVHDDGLSVIANGSYEGMTLKEYISQNPKVLGENNEGDELPILIKLIDASDNLSVQVHPDDETAKKMENQNGKTEMWYVVECDENSYITCGVKEDITKEELENSIKDNSVEALLNKVKSKKGDVFFVESGTIHAIGKGNVIAEIQQNSNVTYRLYDYDRRDKNNNPRELHIEKGVMVSNTKKSNPRAISLCSDSTRLIGDSKYFSVKELKLNGKKTFVSTSKTYMALLNVSGNAKINSMDFNKGECVFVPASYGEFTITGDATILIASNPPKYYVDVNLVNGDIVFTMTDEFSNTYESIKIKSFYNTDDFIHNITKCADISGVDFENVDYIKINGDLTADIKSIENKLFKKVLY